MNDILLQEDIEGLVANGAPDDEYRDEAAQIAAALEALPAGDVTEDKVVSIIALVWAKSFELSAQDMELRLPAISRVAHAILSSPSAV